MNELAVLTPSYRGDAALFEGLHRSVLANTAPGVVHHVVTPPSDAHLFREYAGDRCRIWTHRDLMPSGYLPVPWADGLALNLRRPWPPVRGWVVQQLMKMAATAACEAPLVLIVDSDAVLVRQVKSDDLMRDGRALLYRADDAVTAEMPRHVVWHEVARRLLGVPGKACRPLPDYVSAMSVWDPAVLRDLAGYLQERAGRPWFDVVARELHVSEFVLYGVFVDQVRGGALPVTPTLCHNYYDRVPLDPAGALAFAERLPADAVGAMISSHSHTPADVRAAAFARCVEVAERYAREP